MSSMISQGDSEGLRRVEKDVLITKKVKEKAMKFCVEFVKEFEDCVRGRTVTAAWKCREPNRKMKDCLTSYHTDAAFYEECKNEYLEERKQFRVSGQAPKNTERTSS